jgi:hypothetical protein
MPALNNPALLPAHAYQYPAKEPYSDTVKARHHLVVLDTVGMRYKGL